MFRMGNEEVEAVARVIASKELFRVNEGLKETERFEEEWAEKIGCDFSILMSSGTGALISALVGMGRYETVDDGPYKGMFYIPQQSDRTTNRALIYNPTSGEAMHVFIGDIPS